MKQRTWPKGGGVYALTIGGEPRYVGYTNNFRSRFNIHRSALRLGNSKNVALQKAFNDDARLGFIALEELDESVSELSKHIERAWIL